MNILKHSVKIPFFCTLSQRIPSNYLRFHLDSLKNTKLHTIHKIYFQLCTFKQKIRVATLNFSGINLNPFEYHNGNLMLDQASKNMQQILSSQGELLEPHLKVIDKAYSGVNINSVRFGTKVCESGKLLNLEQYRKVWTQFYLKNKPLSILNETQEQIQSLMLFDYYCYISIIKCVYKLEWSKEKYQMTWQYPFINTKYQIKNIENMSSDKLYQFLTNNLNQPASKIYQKFRFAHQYYICNQLDIFFIQQCGQVIWIEDQINNEYAQIKSGNSTILYKKNILGQSSINLTNKYGHLLNFNNDSTYFFSDKGYLLISVHLSSKPQLFHIQIQELIKNLSSIIEQSPELIVIIGMDANHFIGSNKQMLFNYCPKQRNQYTTKKMRTRLQTQLKKANVLNQEAKDFIMTNLKINAYSVEKINGERIKDQDMLPSLEHPFDHFVVRAQLQRR